MNQCHDSGALRAYLDHELGQAEQLQLEAHIATCAACREDLDHVRAHADLASTLLAVPQQPGPQAALAQLYATVQQQAPSTRRIPSPRRHAMKLPQPRRWLAAAGALALAIGLFTLPPMRAAADQVLQIFRVQTVVFVPVSQERMQQLSNLNFDGKSLFLAEPKVSDGDHAPRIVASAEEASAALGFTIEQPANLQAPLEATYSVTDRKQAEFQVNVASARQFLQLAGVTDITLPDALGARPITVNLDPVAMATYRTGDTKIELIQGMSPQVNLPEGVELRDLGRAALRVLGMAPEQADALASQIDWSSTLVFPFPADPSSVRQVMVNGAPGLLMTSGGRSNHEATLYWQRGGIFYVIQYQSDLRGDDQVSKIIQIAESVR